MIKTIYLAGGCFWGTERAFQMLKGVTDTTVGYANGHTENPTYKEVCTDTTGFRETVRIDYDDTVLSLETVLKAYFMCIDPTIKDRQGNDVGSQYQTGVYYIDDESRAIAERVFEEKKKEYPVFCVELEPIKNFYDAEEYHQDYLIKNPTGYCHITKAEFDEVKALNPKD